jgi:hypothetical protein
MSYSSSAQDHYWDDLEKIFKEIGKLKMSKNEYNQTIDILSDPFKYYNSRTSENRDKGILRDNTQSDKAQNKVKELTKTYIHEPSKVMKESYILKWDDFIPNCTKKKIIIKIWKKNTTHLVDLVRIFYLVIQNLLIKS